MHYYANLVPIYANNKQREAFHRIRAQGKPLLPDFANAAPWIGMRLAVADAYLRQL
jgi:hypothetical protein